MGVLLYLTNHGAYYTLAYMLDVNKTVYVKCQTMCMFLQEVQKMKNIDELEAFMLKHGENIVDMMGAEIDRIEMKLRVSSLTSLETQMFLNNAVKVRTNLFCLAGFISLDILREQIRGCGQFVIWYTHL